MSSEKDFATGKPVAAHKPEERVRQEFERILHGDLGYPKECLDIEVPIQMGSATKRCDIAAYASKDKREIVGIVETKASGQPFEEGQLQSYMSVTPSCYWGVWTNGDELHCARREADGKVVFDAAFSIPRFGEREVNIHSFGDLRPASNLKWVFRRINNRLFANSNLSRTEKLGAEMVRFIFCKLADEYDARRDNTPPQFQVMSGEAKTETRKRINALWKKTRDGRLGAPIFKGDEKIESDDYSLQLIVSSLQGYSLLSTDRDVVGDAFEVFAERQFAGNMGQFFTPRAVVNMVINMINPTENDLILDPACGSGGFLISALSHITRKHTNDEEKRQIAEHCLYGIDKDSDLSRICKAQMSILGDGKSNIVTANSLESRAWNDLAKSKLLANNGEHKQFDIVITNPPFGSNIKVEQKHILEKYDLGHEWKRQGVNARGEPLWVMDGKKTKPRAPQVLFIELCLRFLKDGGRLGIVLPDGLLGNPSDGYIRQWLASQATILAVVDCPVQTFMPHTGTKTSVLILQKTAAEGAVKAPFMGVAEQCGHTNRGTPTGKEDFSGIANLFCGKKTSKHLGFRANHLKRGILVPRYYDPRILHDISELEKAGATRMVSIEELQEHGMLEVSGVPTSAESRDYDLHGTVRFVRTSDVAAYEIYERTQKNVSEHTYQKYRERQDLQVGDILFVKDGDDKIGETAILMDGDDCKILVQTHFKKLRASGDLDPFLLLWMLNTPIVRRQIRQRVFNQSTLSTIGDRIPELRLPMLANEQKQKQAAEKVRSLIKSRRDALRGLKELDVF